MAWEGHLLSDKYAPSILTQFLSNTEVLLTKVHIATLMPSVEAEDRRHKL